MGNDKSFSVAARIRSVRYALAGLWLMLKTQHNAWVHFAATVAVCIVGIYYRVSAEDWRWLVVAIVMVWIAEALNTAFEHLCDVVSPEFHISVKHSKDIAAGAVLICASGAVCLGLMVFWPYFVR
jgi:diacylglycerol kinase (ATP)